MVGVGFGKKNHPPIIHLYIQVDTQWRFGDFFATRPTLTLIHYHGFQKSKNWLNNLL